MPRFCAAFETRLAVRIRQARRGVASVADARLRIRRVGAFQVRRPGGAIRSAVASANGAHAALGTVDILDLQALALLIASTAASVRKAAPFRRTARRACYAAACHCTGGAALRNYARTGLASLSPVAVLAQHVRPNLDAAIAAIRAILIRHSARVSAERTLRGAIHSTRTPRTASPHARYTRFIPARNASTEPLGIFAERAYARARRPSRKSRERSGAARRVGAAAGCGCREEPLEVDAVRTRAIRRGRADVMRISAVLACERRRARAAFDRHRCGALGIARGGRSAVKAHARPAAGARIASARAGNRAGARFGRTAAAAESRHQDDGRDSSCGSVH